MVLSFLVSQSPNITMGFIYPLTIKNGPLEKPPVLVKEIIYDIILDFCVPHLDSLHGLFGIVGGGVQKFHAGLKIQGLANSVIRNML